MQIKLHHIIAGAFALACGGVIAAPSLLRLQPPSAPASPAADAPAAAPVEGLVLTPSAAIAATRLDVLPGEERLADFIAAIPLDNPPDPERARLAFLNAQNAASVGEDWSALDFAWQAILAGDDSAQMWAFYADINRRRGNNDQALLSALTAIAKSSRADQGPLYQFVGEIYEADSLNEPAVEAYRRAVDRGVRGPLVERLAQLTGERLAMRQFTVNADRDSPSVCASFSWPLADQGVNYADFVALSDNSKPNIAVSDSELCLEGLTHGAQFDLTLRAGLPAASGARLAAPITQNVTIGDRPARLAFRSDKYILPRVKSAGAPLAAVNVAQAEITIYQVPERNLAPQLQQGSALEELYPYAAANISDRSGREVWKGIVDLGGERNREQVFGVPIDAALPDRAPGLYALTAKPVGPKTSEGGDEWGPIATQWLVVTDMGLTSYSGRDGVTVIARSYATGKPIAGAEIALVARNNLVLATQRSNRDGQVRFDPGLARGEGGLAPKLVVASDGKRDFTFLDLERGAFDLTDRGVGGRPYPGPLDAFVYLDRGIYRPGETVRLSAIVRTPEARAPEASAPLTLRVFRPDGSEARRQTLPPTSVVGGLYRFDLAVPDSARTGLWRASLHVTADDPAIGEVSYSVEDFVPAVLEVTLAPNKPAVDSTGITAKANAQFLYGAPGAQLRARGETLVRRASAPFPGALERFSFGLIDESWTDLRGDLSLPQTNEAGDLTVSVGAPKLPVASHPLEMLVRATVFDDGGRPVARAFTAPIARPEPYVGLRRIWGDARLSENSVAEIEVASVNWQGAPVAADALSWRLQAIEFRYSWQRINGSWRFHRHQRAKTIGSGALATDASGRAKLATDRLGDGYYRLEVYDPAQGAARRTAASIEFSAGWRWGAIAADDTPDTVSISLQKQRFAPGETAQFFVKAPFDGEGELVIATDRVLHTTRFSASSAGSVVSAPVSTAWGGGAYAIVHVFRGGDGSGGGDAPIPGRAIGAVWAPIDASARVLTLNFDAPERLRPRQKVEIPLQIDGAAGDFVAVTLAAVDEGVLQLTDFVSPDPVDYFFGKRRLGVDIRDAYGQLLSDRVSQILNLRQGGDAAGKHAAGLPDRWIKPVALFQGFLKVEKGRVRVPLELPEFNGSLRLMAVAATSSKVGSVAKRVLVRDDIVLSGSPPRFLSPGDRAEMTLTFHALEGGAVKLAPKMTASGAVSAEQTLGEIALQPGQRLTRKVVLRANEPGSSLLVMEVDTPKDGKRRLEWPLTVRPSGPLMTQSEPITLANGADLRLDARLFANFYAADARATVAFSALPNFDLPGLISQLDKYPYGCVEQTISTAAPWLYAGDLARTLGLGLADADAQKLRIEKAIGQVLARQTFDGGFGLWSSNQQSDVWLTAYALDFLLEAQKQGYAVDKFALERARDKLQNYLQGAEFAGPDLHRKAFAFAALARANAVERGAARAFADGYAEKFPSPLAKAQMGYALALAGDGARAQRLLTEAVDQARAAPASGPNNRRLRWESGDYGTMLRDKAAILALALDSGLTLNEAPQLAQAIAADKARARYLSTQEQAWLLRAAQALVKSQGPVMVTADGAQMLPIPAGAMAYLRADADARNLAQGVSFSNKEARPVQGIITTIGAPRAPQPAENAGISIQRNLWTMNGEAVDLASIRQNDLIVVDLTMSVAPEAFGNVLVVDYLPAGFEIENPRFGQSSAAAQLAWLENLSEPDHVDLRDDRFIASVDAQSWRSRFRLFYLARAVTPGDYVLPGAFAENMYLPNAFGRGDAGRVQISQR